MDDPTSPTKNITSSIRIRNTAICISLIVARIVKWTRCLPNPSPMGVSSTPNSTGFAVRK
jgi:hypothetical protein